MLKRFDHIIKKALENYMAPHIPDWDVFYDLLLAEQETPMTNDQIEEDDFGDVLANLDYTGAVPAWAIFENRLDDLNNELDQEFDQNVGDTLNNIPESTWGAGQWTMMSSRLDDLNNELDKEFDQNVGDTLNNIPESTWGAGQWALMSSRLDDLNNELDQEFDQSVSDALVNIPEATWKERHWQMLSSRLDELNNRPRLLMMKVIEAAAILLILLQLTNLYSDYQEQNGRENTLTGYFDQIFNRSDKTNENSGNTTIVPPNSLSPSQGQAGDQVTEKSSDQNEQSKNQFDPTGQTNSLESGQPVKTGLDRQSNDFNPHVPSNDLRQQPLIVLPLSPRVDDQIDNLSFSGKEDISAISQANKVLPTLTTSPQLIDYDNSPDRLLNTSPRLDVRDISLLSTRSSDSILNSIPTFQIIKPRLHSSMEVGMLADATNVEIQDYFATSGPSHESTLNGGLYFRYKIQYQDMFGSLGGDYLRMNYGFGNKNELSMLTLPLELGYNVVNLPAFRMYFSGGIAGRFVPVANYSTETYNQSSDYDLESNKPSNGLLNNGPFEINSYLSGRLSLGLDINVNSKTSINLRFSHDIWLKGRGIGYNLDKFNSNHISIGTNFHF